MDPTDLDSLLTTLRKHKVAVFKQDGLAIQFDPDAFTGERPIEGADPESIAEARQAERKQAQDRDLYWSTE